MLKLLSCLPQEVRDPIRRWVLRATHRIWHLEVCRILAQAQAAGVITPGQWQALSARFNPIGWHLVANDRDWYQRGRPL